MQPQGQRPSHDDDRIRRQQQLIGWVAQRILEDRQRRQPLQGVLLRKRLMSVSLKGMLSGIHVIRPGREPETPCRAYLLLCR